MPIIHRDTQTASVTAGTNLSITRPVGTVANDQLLAFIATRADASVTVTPPTGWTFVRRDTQGGFAFDCYRRTSTGSGANQYNFGLSPVAYAVGSISCYSGVDPTSPIDLGTGKVDQYAVRSISSPLLASSSDGGMVAIAYAQASPSTYSNLPNGFTQRSALRSGTNVRFDCSMAVLDRLQPGGGVVPVQSILAPCGSTATLVVGNATTPAALDNAMATSLQSMGYTVTFLSQSLAQATLVASAVASDVCVISESVTSGTLSTKLRDADIGIACGEGFVFDLMRMATTAAERGTSNSSAITIEDSTHPLAAGKSGTVAAWSTANTNERISYSSAANAIKVTSIASTQFAAFMYEKGGLLADGVNNAVARRVGATIAGTSNSVFVQTDNVFDFFRASVDIASRYSTSPQAAMAIALKPAAVVPPTLPPAPAGAVPSSSTLVSAVAASVTVPPTPTRYSSRFDRYSSLKEAYKNNSAYNQLSVSVKAGSGNSNVVRRSNVAEAIALSLL